MYRISIIVTVALILLFTLYSVATTTSKNVATVQREIQAVLDRIGIRYRPSKTGFECVHVPSIDLSSVQPLEGTSASLNKADSAPVTNGLGQSDRFEIGYQPSQLTTTCFIHSSGSKDFDAWAFSENGAAGSALLVRFEISIVKVSSGARGYVFHDA
jgi:hypothetical protein